MNLVNATDFYKTEVKNIYLLVHRGKLHLIHNSRGDLMVCNNSLFDYFEQRETQPLGLNQFSTQIC